MKRNARCPRSLPLAVVAMLVVAASLGFVACGCRRLGARGLPVGVPIEMIATGDTHVSFGGGSITLPAPCGYTVTSRDDATAPRFGAHSLGKNPVPRAIHLGNASDPATSMVISWRTGDDATEATTVQFGEGAKLDQRSDGLVTDFKVARGRFAREHETHLCGLRPDTVYSYRVGGSDEKSSEKSKQSWSAVAHFRTAPAKGSATAPITIGFLGDTRNGTAEWGKELAKLDALAKPDVIFFSGDAILDGGVQSDWDDWFAAGGDVLSRVPLVAAMGNHEANQVNYFTQFSLPGNEEAYGLDYGPVHLTVLNDTPEHGDDIAGKEAAFLDADLTASASATWHFVMHHKPLYSSDDAHGGEASLVAAWGPIYDKHHVDLVLSGHVHAYERTRPIKAGQPQENPRDGTIYVVSGGGGAPLYPVNASAMNAFAQSAYHFCVISILGNTLTFNAYKDDGSVLDTFTITK